MSTQVKTEALDYRRDEMGDWEQEDWQHYAAQRLDRAQDLVRDNAGRSLMIAFGTGMGLGILLGCAMSDSQRSSRWIDRSTAERLGRRFLDKVESMMPNAISDRLP